MFFIMLMESFFRLLICLHYVYEKLDQARNKVLRNKWRVKNIRIFTFNSVIVLQFPRSSANENMIDSNDRNLITLMN